MAAKTSVDFLAEQGYFTLNPGCFDLQSWEYKSLQKLCNKLKVKCTGSRDDLVRRLVDFHNAHRGSFGAGAFHNIGVDIHSPNKTTFKVDSKYVSPMVCRSNGDSILKRVESANKFFNDDSVFSRMDIDEDVVMEEPVEQKTPHRNRTPCKTPRSKKTGGKSAKRIAFSPYNQVKLIPNRRDVRLYSPSCGSPGDYDIENM
jgi:hypothetical protein